MHGDGGGPGMRNGQHLLRLDDRSVRSRGPPAAPCDCPFLSPLIGHVSYTRTRGGPSDLIILGQLFIRWHPKKKKRILLARNLDGSFRTVLIDLLVAIRRACAVLWNSTRALIIMGTKRPDFNAPTPKSNRRRKSETKSHFSYIILEAFVPRKVIRRCRRQRLLISFLSFQRDSIHQLMELSCFVSNRFKTFRQRINWPGRQFADFRFLFLQFHVGVRHFLQICRCL